MRILVTGATGVIGRRLVPLLCDAGHNVTAAVRSRARAGRLSRQGAAVAEVDLFDRSAVQRAVAGHDAVVNLATHIPKPSRILLPWAWSENDRLRRAASAALVDACLASDVSRFIQESFAPVYPDRADRWIDETTPIEPVRYNRSVTDAEASARRFSRAGRTGLIVRFGGFYGPDADQTIELIRMVRKGWALLPGPEGAFISSISHDDAAAAVAATLTIPAGVYNVVDDEPVTHRVFVNSLAQTLGVGPPRLPPVWLTPLFGSIGKMAARSLRISNRKLRSASGWKPRVPSVREGWLDVVAGIEARRLTAA
ncbi:MAG TPA: NAD(P)-dependent oxidoreductase [Vicinamibacterales bacterium]